MDHKKGLIHTLLFRAYNICADYVTLHTERNSFPLFFIVKCIKRFLDKLFIKRNISGTVSKKKEVFICLEFLGKMSLQNKKQLIEIVQAYQKNIKLNVVFRSPNRIRNAFRFKDQIPQYKKASLSCSWEINTYRKELKYTEKDATAIRKHCYNHVHTADTSCFSLVGNAANKYHLKLKESLLILKMKPSLNVAKESMPLHLFENDL